jgi:hypothetical protein
MPDRAGLVTLVRVALRTPVRVARRITAPAVPAMQGLEGLRIEGPVVQLIRVPVGLRPELPAALCMTAREDQPIAGPAVPVTLVPAAPAIRDRAAMVPGARPSVTADQAMRAEPVIRLGSPARLRQHLATSAPGSRSGLGEFLPV